MRKTWMSAAVLATALGAVPGLGADNGGFVDFGVAYYPEAWPEERWETDFAMMNELGIDLVRCGEFNWAQFEPTEGVFNFEPYLRMVALAHRHGIRVMMCTPTAASPKWMQRDYPETEKTREDGTKPGPGGRQTACISSEKFRFFSRRITEKMAEAFKDCPAVTTWQLDNELSIFGARGMCVCENCRKAYIESLKRRYGTLENLNREFNGCFWSGTFSKWDDVRLPLWRTRPGWCRDYVRFLGDEVREAVLEQAAILRRTNPKWRITTNNPSAANMARHDLIFRNLGYAAADTYITRYSYDGLLAHLWTWRMFAGLTGSQKPFMVGETGPFSFDAMDERGYDKLKPWMWLSIGCGAESYVYFRWRESVNGEECHPAILPWSGRRTFVYDLVKKNVEEMKSLPESIARLPLDRNRVAIVHDHASHLYSLEHAVLFGNEDKTDASERRLLGALMRRGVQADMIAMLDLDRLGEYDLVFLPLALSVSEEDRAKIRAYVEMGGRVVAADRFNFASPDGGSSYAEVCPVGMTDFFGIEIDERRSIPNGIIEMPQPTTAETLLSFTNTCFKGNALLTCNRAGKGRAYYFARTPDVESARALVDTVLGREGIAMREPLPDGVVRMTRGGYVILVNYLEVESTVQAEAGELVMGSPKQKDGRLSLAPYEVCIFRSNRK